ncbi:MAG: BON domain-containing protein, partial [Pseudomonadota bacterium]
MGRLLTFLSIAAAVILLIWCLSTHPDAIQADLTEKSNSKLLNNDMAFATATLDGRDATLTGAARSAEARDAAAALVAGVSGVRVVNNEITVVAPAPREPAPPPPPAVPFDFDATLATGVLTLTGTVPSDADRQSIVTYAGTQFPVARIVDEMKIGAEPAADWRGGIDVGLAQLARLAEGRLALDDVDWALRGLSPDVATRDDILAAVDTDLASAFNPELALEVLATAEEVDQCQEDFNGLMASNRILFAVASADIDTSSIALLDELSEVA